jgi:hypothetical protein
MTLSAMFPNHLAKYRAAAGLSAQDVATRSGLEPHIYTEMEAGRLLPNQVESERIEAVLGVGPTLLYDHGTLNTVGDKRYWDPTWVPGKTADRYRDVGRLLLAPHETPWMDHHHTPDREVDIFLNLSCGAAMVPHLNLDLMAVLDVLGVRHAAGSGRQFCCSSGYRRFGRADDGKRAVLANQARAASWRATTIVHGCTQCVNTFNEMQRRRKYIEGIDDPEEQSVTHTDVLRFLDEKLTELGDGVPWKKEVRSKIVIHGHPRQSWVEQRNKRDVALVARHIPGVEVMGMLDRTSMDSLCSTEPGVTAMARPKTRAEVDALRDEVAMLAELWGADTISPAHHDCLREWSKLASDRVDVRHVISQLADALGLSHTDRFKAAAQLGSIDEILEQTRPCWSEWGMSEGRAREVAESVFDPAYSQVGSCACGRDASDRCGHDQLISVDVLSGTVIPR